MCVCVCVHACVLHTPPPQTPQKVKTKFGILMGNEIFFTHPYFTHSNLNYIFALLILLQKSMTIGVMQSLQQQGFFYMNSGKKKFFECRSNSLKSDKNSKRKKTLRPGVTS